LELRDYSIRQTVLQLFLRCPGYILCLYSNICVKNAEITLRSLSNQEMIIFHVRSAKEGRFQNSSALLHTGQQDQGHLQDQDAAHVQQKIVLSVPDISQTLL